MLRITHLLDDFNMGGVARALSVFDEPELAALAISHTVPVAPNTRIAPRVDSDIIVTHFPPSWARLGFFRSLRLRNPSARLIHIEHSYTRCFERHNVPQKGRFRFMLRRALAGVDDIICVSDGQRKWLNDVVGIRPDKCRTIYPWSGREELLQLPPPDRGTHAPLRLAAYGRYSDVKNFGALIDAVAASGPQVELAMAGAGPEEPDLIARARPASNVTIHGQISDIGTFLSAADAVIVPSLWEAFGLVATEARLAGRPIIVSEVDGLPEQVGQGGVCAPCTTSAEIAAAIEQFRRQPFGAMSAAARRDAAGLRDQIIEQWLTLFRG